jgi:TM2 domain-containing membrane protein YozV
MPIFDYDNDDERSQDIRPSVLAERPAQHLTTGQQTLSGQCSDGNVVAALPSFSISGLGQLVLCPPIAALIEFVLAALLWLVLLGWIVYIRSILYAAWQEPDDDRRRPNASSTVFGAMEGSHRGSRPRSALDRVGRSTQKTRFSIARETTRNRMVMMPPARM